MTEVEIHGTVAAFDEYGVGLGAGLRLTMPLVDRWPFKRFDNELAVAIGFEAVRYGGYRPGADSPSSTNPIVVTMAYYFPVALQWSVWLGSVASVFVEPTLIYRYAAYVDSCDPALCTARQRVLPTLFVGARFRLLDHLAVTIRAGWPMFVLGVSWL